MALDFEATTADTIFFPLTVTLPVTLACWTQNDTTSTRCLSVGDSGGTAFHSIGGASGVWRATTFDGSVSSNVDGGVDNTDWTHLMGVFASLSSRNLFEDGVAQTENTSTRSAFTMDRLAIGSSADGTPNQEYDGRIAECAVWSAALTAVEGAMLFAGVCPLLVRPASLVFYLPCWNVGQTKPWIGPAATSFGNPLDFAHPPNMRYPPNVIKFYTQGAAAAAAARSRLMMMGVG